MIKLGVDLVLNSRFEKYLENMEFLEKVFHSPEIRDKKKLVGIFALKEATMKAIGKKLDWKDIEIKFENKGKPKIILSDNIKPKGFKGIDGSISHDGDYTIGAVVIELKG